MIRSLEELTPATARAATDWLDASVASLPEAYRGVVRDELLTSLCEAVEPAMTPEEFARAVEKIGVFVVEDEEPEPDDVPREASTSPLVGTWLGIPYDFRPPTGERIRQSMWNPTDPHVMMPRAFGAGWDLNLGAVAVRLGIIEPDAEDVPFASVPQDAYAVAAALPLALTAAVVAHYAVRGATLDADLPSHWGPAGVPDAWVPRARAGWTDVLTAAAGGALAASAVRSRRSGAERAGRLAVATAVAGLAATITVSRTAPKGGWWVGPALVASMVAGTAAPLLGLALAGRRGEQRRDLGVREGAGR